MRLTNLSDEEYEVKAGDRIAQLVLHEKVAGRFNQVEEFSPAYNRRGEAGFGSSGK